MDLFKILGKIAIENSGANKTIDDTSDKAKGASKEVGKFGDEGDKAEGKLSKAFSKIGSAAVKVGKVVGTGLAAGATAMGKLTMSALNAAGELEQNMGGSEAVFKQYASNMQKTAAGAYESMGLSQSNFLATANKMGALFQGSGFTIKESMEMTSDAMQRAADVASIMGLDTSSAMEAVAGAAKGNFTMMDNLGVAINDTTLQIYAQEKGLGKLETTQDKVGAAMQMFLEKTTYATGNYKKENETLAGSLSTAKAAFENFLSGAGNADQLASAFTNAATVIIKNLNDIFPKLTSGLTTLVNKLVPEIPGLLQSVLPGLISGAEQLISGLVSASPAIFATLIDVLPMLLSALDEITASLVEALPQIIEQVVAFISNPSNIQLLINAAVTLFTALPLAITEALPAIIEAAPQIIVGVMTGLSNAAPKLLSSFKEILKNLLDSFLAFFGIQSPSTVMQEKAKFIVDGVINGIKELPEKAAEWFSKMKEKAVEIFDNLKEKAKEKFDNLKEAASEKFENIKEAISSKVESARTKAAEGFENLKTSVTEKAESARDKVKTAFEDLHKSASSTWDSMKKSASDKFEEVRKGMSDPVQKAKEKIDGIVSKLKTIFNFKWELPPLKLPHISVSGGVAPFGIGGKGSLPSFSIKWYKKAYDNPMMLKKPAIFGLNPMTGEFMGGGDKPSEDGEVVSGAGRLMQMIQAAVSIENSTTVYYLERIMNFLAELLDGLPDWLNVDVVANDGTILAHYSPLMDKELGKIKKQKDRGR